MKVLAAYTILCYWFCYVYTARKIPDYVNICKRTDPEISKCWQETVRELRPYLIKGIPEFDIPSIEPLQIDKIHLDQGNTPTVSFIANLTNLKFYGGGEYDVPFTHADILNTRTVNLGLTFPKLSVVGDYEAKGRVLLFQFEGAGKFTGEVTNAKMNGTWYFKIINKKGKEHFTIEEEHMDVDVDKMSVHLDGLFSGNPQLTENVNNAINENIDTLYNDFKPLVTITLQTVSRQYFNRVFNLFPYDVLLPKE